MNLFFRTLLITALSGIAISVHAQEGASGSKGISDSGVHFIVTAGITGGGDTISTVQYTNGTSSSIKGGGLVQLGGGLLWQADAIPLATAFTVNYHVSDSSCSNCDIRFDRTPLELLAYYTGAEKWRIGGGVRFVQSPKYRQQIDHGRTDSIDFENTTGTVVEVGYGFTSKMWMNVRYVSEKYKPTSVTTSGTTYSAVGGPSVDGSHVGVSMLYQF